jgi:hypothetical protein
MKKKIIFFLAGLLIQLNVGAQCITLTSPGNTMYCFPPSFSNSVTGTLSGLAGGNYYYTITRSGDFTTTNLQFSLNGLGWTASTLSTVFSGANSFAISGYLPGTALCGQHETIEMKIFNAIGSQVCTTTFTVVKTAQSISGSASLCPSTSGTYSVSSPAFVTPAGNYTWTTSTAGWLINGLPSPVTTTSSSVTITAPATTGTTSLCVNNAYMCQPVCLTLSNAIPAMPTYSSSNKASDCIGVEVNWTIAPVPFATSYTWSTTSTGVIISPSGLSCTIMGATAGGKIIKVKANNGCGSSALRSSTFTVSNTGPCGPKSFESGEAESVVNEVKLFPNPVSDHLNLEISSVVAQKLTITVYNLNGEKIYSQVNGVEVGTNNLMLDFNNFSNGLYLLMIDNGETIQKHKISVIH